MSQERVRRTADFRRVIQEGRSTVSPLGVLYILPSGRGTGRVGLAVGKRLGNAVVRNRLRRRWREVLRLSGACVPAGWDAVLLARGAGRQANFQDLMRTWRELLRRSGLVGDGARANG